MRLLSLCTAALLLGGCGGGPHRGSAAAVTSRYSHSLHSRFYEAWIQPKVVGAPRGEVSVPVDVRIAPDGRVLSFKPLRLSGYPHIDRSIAAVGTRVRKVPAPPITRGEFRLRIYFDLDVKR